MHTSEPNAGEEIVRRCGPAARASFPQTLAEGLSAPWAGLKYMADRPALWRYGLWPVLLNLAITGLLAALLAAGGVYLFTTVHPRLHGSWWGLLGEVVLVGLFAVAALGAAVAAWIVLQAVLCSWFYDRLARQVELQLGTDGGELRAAPLAAQTIDALRAAGFLIAANAVCLGVQLIPVVGAPLGLCGGCYFICATLGFEYFDYPLALRGLRRRDKIAFVRRHRVSTLGLGAAVAALAVVPVLNAVFLTTAVVGAVLLHRRLSDVS
jgi:CysZ protein